MREMCKFIEIEDLVANALIELKENNGGRRVSFDKLNEYGTKIVQFIQENTDEDAVLLISKYYTSELISNYSEFFEVIDRDESSFIQLKSEKSADDLRKRFRAYLSNEMLVAFTDKNSLQALGVET